LSEGKVTKKGKALYDYQLEDIKRIFTCYDKNEPSYNLLYQLPTGGGKTVIFSEIARQFIEKTGKKVLILTHRIELSRQTSGMLQEFGVHNKVINSQVKELPDQNKFQCFVAMVETLNNRLQDDKWKLENLGLVIIDEAHYNSFVKLLKYFVECRILGVTATPLSSNVNIRMKDHYKELITGYGIPNLIEKGFLAKATTYSYEVGLGSLKVGINGDYTVKSSQELYTNEEMRSKLLYAYEQRAKNKKTLIFNNGIDTSKFVYETFRNAKYDIRHLDNTNTKKQREEILQWFHTKPNAIITSVGILTTGFDEPSIETIILNRATRSLALYFQMVGRGSRIYKDKKTFDIIDLGNNAARFGLWSNEVDWQKIFRNPSYFLENIISDSDIEKLFKYIMPDEIRSEFPNTEELEFDVKTTYDNVLKVGKKSQEVIDLAIEHHAKMLLDNSEDLAEALRKFRLLDESIKDIVRRFSYCIANSTRNFRDWLIDDFKTKLRKIILSEF